MRTRVTQLWQTRLLRFSKLTVADEIENALSYYEATFLREIPRVYAELEKALAHGGSVPSVAPFLRMGQWIGGDRDGNPNVTAETLEYALRRQSRTGAAPLPDRSALPRRRTVAVGHAGRRVGRDAGTGRALARQERAPGRRALPPGADRHLLAAGRHPARSHGRRGRAPRGAAAEPLSPRPRNSWPTCAPSRNRSATSTAPCSPRRACIR